MISKARIAAAGQYCFKTLGGVIILAFFFAGCQNTEKQKKKTFLQNELVLSKIEQCQFRGSLVELKKGLKEDPKDVFLLNNLGLVYFVLKQYQLATKQFKKALQLNPRLTRSRISLARSFIEQGFIDKAIAQLNIARKDLTFNSPEEIHSHMGLALFFKKNYKEAEENFSIARMMKETECVPAIYHARSFFELGNYKKAVQILENAKQWCINNKSPCDSAPNYDPFYYVALAYVGLGKMEKGKSSMEVFFQNSKNETLKKSARGFLEHWSQ